VFISQILIKNAKIRRKNPNSSSSTRKQLRRRDADEPPGWFAPG
jgi:hypothetical protein